MEEGKIYEIVWDNGCFDCKDNCKEGLSSENVFNSTIKQTYNNCYETEGEENGNTRS